MKLDTFPFRLDQNTLSLVSGLLSALMSHNAKLQSHARGGGLSVLFDKSKTKGTMDVNVTFTDEAIILQYPLQALRKDSKIRSWLNAYHAHLQKTKKDTLTPVMSRCFVTVKAFYTGQLQYYLTYMVSYPDDSIAQETPQGALYASEGLLGVRAPAQASDDASDAGGGVW